MALNAVDPATIIASGSRGSVLQVVIPPDMSKVKSYHNTKFINVKMTALASDSKPIDIIYAGRTEPLNIPILFGAPDPATDQGITSNKRVGICLSLPTCGELGTALEVIERDFLAQMRDPKVIEKLWTDDTPPQYPCHIKRTYGKKCKDQSKKGLDRDEPLVDLRAEFGKFSDKFFKKALAGKPNTTIYDWNSRTINEANQEMFNERTDVNGQTFNTTNASQILAKDDIIRRIAIKVDSVSVSDRGIALRLCIYKVWTERMTGEINFIPVANASEFAPIATGDASHNDIASSQIDKKSIVSNDDGTYEDDDN